MFSGDHGTPNMTEMWSIMGEVSQLSNLNLCARDVTVKTEINRVLTCQNISLHKLNVYFLIETDTQKYQKSGKTSPLLSQHQKV